MVYYPTDLELISVTAVDYKELTEIGWKHDDPYGNFIRTLYVKRKGEIIRRSDVEPTFLSPLAKRLKSIKPHRPMLRVEFKSKENLAKYVYKNDFTLSLQGYFCGHYYQLTDRVAVQLGGPVYWGPFNLSWPMNYMIEQEAGEPITYRTYMAVELSPNSRDPDRPHDSFDFRDKPRDVCFFLVGGAAPAPTGFKSNKVKIPKAVIEEALKDLPPALRVKGSDY